MFTPQESPSYCVHSSYLFLFSRSSTPPQPSGTYRNSYLFLPSLGDSHPYRVARVGHSFALDRGLDLRRFITLLVVYVIEDTESHSLCRTTVKLTSSHSSYSSKSGCLYILLFISNKVR